MQSLCSIALLELAILAFALACGTTPTARLPIEQDCLAKSQQCTQGWVIVEADISPAGTVDHAEIVEACPDHSFNWTALNSVKTWKWKPSPDGEQDHQVRLCRP
jgi:TonB family protein